MEIERTDGDDGSKVNAGSKWRKGYVRTSFEYHIKRYEVAAKNSRWIFRPNFVCKDFFDEFVISHLHFRNCRALDGFRLRTFASARSGRVLSGGRERDGENKVFACYKSAKIQEIQSTAAAAADGCRAFSISNM